MSEKLKINFNKIYPKEFCINKCSGADIAAMSMDEFVDYMIRESETRRDRYIVQSASSR